MTPCFHAARRAVFCEGHLATANRQRIEVIVPELDPVRPRDPHPRGVADETPILETKAEAHRVPRDHVSARRIALLITLSIMLRPPLQVAAIISAAR